MITEGTLPVDRPHQISTQGRPHLITLLRVESHRIASHVGRGGWAATPIARQSEQLQSLQGGGPVQEAPELIQKMTWQGRPLQAAEEDRCMCMVPT